LKKSFRRHHTNKQYNKPTNQPTNHDLPRTLNSGGVGCPGGRTDPEEEEEDHQEEAEAVAHRQRQADPRH
tara:strand:+ start:611 stop:820 length:210 start_codon:yes stop_codon:yes gene_type:complete